MGLESGRALGIQDPERLESSRLAERRKLAFCDLTKSTSITDSSANAREVKTKPQWVGWLCCIKEQTTFLVTISYRTQNC